MDNEIQLISDGDGLAVIGDPAAVERFLVSDLGSTVERGFWAVDGMMVQVSGFRLAADREGA